MAAPDLVRLVHDRLYRMFAASDNLHLLSTRPPGRLTRAASYGVNMVKALQRDRREGTQPALPGRILLFSESVNQQRALAPLAGDDDIAQVTTGFAEGGMAFPKGRAYVAGLRALPDMLASHEGVTPDSWRWLADQYLLAHGLYAVARRFFEHHEPALVVFANDHNTTPVILNLACRVLGIRTAYLQHAPITDYFPGLDVDYALLEGTLAASIYASRPSTARRVYLAGAPRLDFAGTANTQPRMTRLGICLNELAATPRIEALLAGLADLQPAVQMTLRPHPGWSNDFPAAEQLAQRYGLAFSDSRTEPPLAWLARQDAVVACDSGIILEAAVRNVYPVSYRLGDHYRDYYHYERRGLVQHFEDLPDLIEHLRGLKDHKPDVADRVEPWNALVGTRWQGRARELLLRTLRALASDDEPADFSPAAFSGSIPQLYRL